MGYPKDKDKQRKIAKERVDVLFQQAKQIFPKNPVRANRYVDLARKIAMKVNIRMPKKFKRQYCKHCFSFLQSGVNSTTRIRDRKVVIYCKECKKYTRIPLAKR